MFFVNGCASQEHNLVAPGIQVLKISLNEDNHSLLLHDCCPFRFRYNFHFIKGKLGKCFFFISFCMCYELRFSYSMRALRRDMSKIIGALNYNFSSVLSSLCI